MAFEIQGIIHSYPCVKEISAQFHLYEMSKTLSEEVHSGGSILYLKLQIPFFSSLLVFVHYRGSMRLLVALYYIADISSVLPDLNFPFFSSKPLTAYFSWVFFYIPTYRELHKLLYHSKIQSPTYLIFRLLNF